VGVTPTLKAAKVAQAEVHTAAGSAASPAFAYGWRSNHDGAWTRLTVGPAEPAIGRPYTGPAEGRGCGPVTCWSWTRPECWIRTPPAPC
jgi:exodeoxyribonuclease V alpha subunit